jgi:hypothetical protein
VPLCARRGLRRPASAGPRARRFCGLPPPARAGGDEWRRGQLGCGRAGGGFVPRGRLGVRVWGSPRRRAGPEALARIESIFLHSRKCQSPHLRSPTTLLRQSLTALLKDYSSAASARDEVDAYLALGRAQVRHTNGQWQTRNEQLGLPGDQNFCHFRLYWWLCVCIGSESMPDLVGTTAAGCWQRGWSCGGCRARSNCSAAQRRSQPGGPGDGGAGGDVSVRDPSAALSHYESLLESLL